MPIQVVEHAHGMAALTAHFRRTQTLVVHHLTATTVMVLHPASVQAAVTDSVLHRASVQAAVTDSVLHPGSVQAAALLGLAKQLTIRASAVNLRRFLILPNSLCWDIQLMHHRKHLKKPKY